MRTKRRKTMFYHSNPLLLLLVVYFGLNSVHALAGTQPVELKLVQDLKAQLGSNPDYTLNFSQSNKNLSTGLEVNGNGTLRVSSIEKFEWIYTSRPQNKIVCDGIHLIMITPDTEQAMIAKSDDLKSIWSPVSIITQSDLSESYSIALVTPENSSPVKLRFTPIKANQQFDFFELVFLDADSPIPFDLIIFDTAGSSNKIRFTDLKSTKHLVPINLPDVPVTYDVTDFQGNPLNLKSFLKGKSND